MSRRAIGTARWRPAVLLSLAVLLSGSPGDMPALRSPPQPVAPRDIPPSAVRLDGGPCLAIEDRPSARGAPPEGWCGEAAIQQALLYFGVYVPQSMINAAGHPGTPDLHGADIPSALIACGMGVRLYEAEADRVGHEGLAGYDDYVSWLRGQIGAGHPVVIAMKINPTRHPEWSADHLLLAIGCSEDSLTFNTTWGYQTTQNFRDLYTDRRGLSFKNAYDQYFGVAVDGRPDHRHEIVRLFVVKEAAGRLRLMVKCEGLEKGSRYVVSRSRGRTGAVP